MKIQNQITESIATLLIAITIASLIVWVLSFFA
jgi:hypothetical protein